MPPPAAEADRTTMAPRGYALVRSDVDRFTSPEGDRLRRIEYGWDYDRGEAEQRVYPRDGQLLERIPQPRLRRELTEAELNRALVSVFKRAHAPMPFADYRHAVGGNRYRDWKDQNSAFLANAAVQSQLGVGANVIASGDRSTHPTQSYGNCPFGLGTRGPGGSTCMTGVAIQNWSDRVTSTTPYVANWPLYAMRWTFHLDGTIDPLFGLGNSNGTYHNVTHRQQNSWRLDFGIDGAGNDRLLLDGQVEANAFTALHARGRMDGVRDAITGRGYDVLPGAATTPPGPMDHVFPAHESGRNFHTVDVMATQFFNYEFADDRNCSLSDCGVHVSALVRPTASILATDVVLDDRAGVRDAAGDFPVANRDPADPMICRSVEPRLVPVGDWSGEELFRAGFQDL